MKALKLLIALTVLILPIAALADGTTNTVSVKPQLSMAKVQFLRKMALGPDGHDSPMSPHLAQSLGFGDGTTRVSFRSLSGSDDITKINYQIFLLPDGGFMIARNDSKTVRVFRLDSDLALIKAVTSPANADRPTSIPSPDYKNLCDADKAK
jgi:hypothetical protein